jgi:phage-related protein
MTGLFQRGRRNCAAVAHRRGGRRMPIEVAEIYPFQDSYGMKPISFLGNSLEWLREFPEGARQDAGYQLDQVQRGKQPSDFKPMASVDKGVEELRVWDDAGTYRVIYLARLKDAVSVLHAFQRKSRATGKQDIETAKTRYAELMRGRR